MLLSWELCSWLQRCTAWPSMSQQWLVVIPALRRWCAAGRGFYQNALRGGLLTHFGHLPLPHPTGR